MYGGNLYKWNCINKAGKIQNIRRHLAIFNLMYYKACLNTPAGSGCIGVSRRTVGIVLCFAGTGLLVAGLDMLLRKK